LPSGLVAIACRRKENASGFRGQRSSQTLRGKFIPAGSREREIIYFL
jgi:hypothetical protein